MQTFPLHPAQKDIYIEQLIHPDSPHYNVGGSMKLTGRLNKEALRKTVNCVPEVFDVFKMRFDLHAQDQLIYFDERYDHLELKEIDLSRSQDPVKAGWEWIRENFNKPFVLDKTSLPFEQALLKISDDEHWLFFKYHHLVTDGLGFAILTQFMAEKYRSLLANTDLSQKYPAYITEVQKASEYYSSKDYAVESKYWSDRIGDAPVKLFQRRYPVAGDKVKSGSYALRLTPHQKQSLLELQSRCNVSLQQLTIAALIIYLSRTTGQKEFVFGVSIHKRRSKVQRSTMGMFAGLIPFKGVYDQDCKLIDFLTEIRNSQKSDYRYQNYPIGDLIRRLKRNATDTDLFEIALNYEPLDLKLDFGPDLHSQSFHLTSEYEKMPIRFCWRDYGDHQPLEIDIDYLPEYFTREELALFTSRIVFILEQFPSSLERTLPDIAILPDAELERLKQFSSRSIEYPASKTVVDLFEEQVLKTPEAIAVAFGDQCLTYDQLDKRSSQLANYLMRKGIKTGSLVPICIERSIELIIGIIGTLKAGCAYVPLDPDYPDDRKRYMLRDCNAPVILSNSLCSLRLSAVNEMIIRLDGDWPAIGNEPEVKPDLFIGSETTAYIMYTSGSTGTPKGVMVTHRNIVSLVAGGDFVSIGKNDRLLSTGSPSFDATTFEYWAMLLCGGQLVLCPKHTLLDIELLSREIWLKGITVMWFTSSWLNQLVDLDIRVLEGLSTIVAGGEKLSEHHIARIKTAYPSLTVINGYGPTENTTFSLTYQIENITTGSIPIGRPLANRSAYVVSAGGELCPIGIVGELWVGGDGLSKGYLGRPELTNEKFIDDRLGAGQGRLYRTGDLARWLPDGNVEFHGRSDDQVKIRGHRIELGEIERVIMESGLVDNAVVVASADQGDKKLVAYIVAEGDCERSSIVDYLAKKLPEYMIPSGFVVLDQLPLTANGKVDKEALPAPGLAGESADAAASLGPANDIEHRIARVWREVLDVEHVSIKDDFFQLGGDSIKIISAVSKLRNEFACDLKIFEVYQASTLEALAALVNSKTDRGHRDDLQSAIAFELAELKQSLLPKLDNATAIEDLYPMSDIQIGMVYASMLEPELAVYHDQLVYPIEAGIHPDVFEKAFALLVRKHPILRTRFNVDVHAEGIQIVYRDIPVNIDRIDLSMVGADEAEERIQRYLVMERARSFNIAKDHLWRAALIHLENKTVFIFQFHHAILDGWSVASFNTELNNLCLRLTDTSEPKPLPLLKCTQKDFIIESLAEKRNEENNLFWRQEMSGYKRLDIFLDEPCSEKLTRSYDPSYLERLKQKAARDRVSLKSVFLSAYLYVLRMLTYDDDLTIGVLTNIRPALADGDKMLGCFLNSTPFRIRVHKSGVTWKNFVTTVDEKLKMLKSKDRSTLLHITRLTGEKQVSGENPFFDTLFNFLNFHVYENFATDNRDLFQSEAEHELTNTFFDCTANVTANVLRLTCVLKRKLRSGKSLNELLGYMGGVIDSYLDDDESTLRNVPLLSPEERRTLFSFCKVTDVHVPAASVLELLEEQRSKTPDNIAVIFADRQMTYRELHRRSDDLADHLIRKGVGEEQLVPVIVERGMEMMIAILGILKAGGAYVPIDPKYPKDRTAYIIKDTKAGIVVTSEQCRAHLPDAGTIITVGIDPVGEVVSSRPEYPILAKVKPENLAYVIYTSGSTGAPKGVMIEHRSVVNLILSQKSSFGIGGQERILQFSNYAFDASVEQIFLALSSGATLVITDSVHSDPAELIKLIHKESVTHLHATPSFLKTMEPSLLTGSRLKRVIAGGEECPAELAERWGRAFTFYNEYGPTETTVTSVMSRYEGSCTAGGSFPIGKPIANMYARIVDKEGDMAPIGSPGELCLAGVGLARGYLNLPETTAEKFVTVAEDGLHKTFYRTGDIARWLPDGKLEFSGRLDDQVKIRGYRIELGEIEHTLRKSGLVKDAVVLAPGDSSGNRRLVAYVIPHESFSRTLISSFLRDHLPEYMVPAVLVELNSFPLTYNGKVDKKSLPNPDVSDLVSTLYTEARNESEVKLTSIWRDILNVQRVGIDDDFFELGGHSLLATRIVSAIRNEFQVELSIKDLFANATVRKLALHLGQRTIHPATVTIKPQARPSPVPLSFSQERLWFIDQLEGSVQYHIPAILRVDGELDVQKLSSAFRGIVDRHEVLRTVILHENGKPYQQVLDRNDWQLNVIQDLGSGKDDGRLNALMADLINIPFDLSRDYPLRAHLIVTGNERRLLVVMHHIAADGWSMPIILHELTALYQGLFKGNGMQLNDLPIQYSDFAIWQRSHLSEEVLATKMSYWRTQLESVVPLDLPTDFSRPSVQSKEGAIAYFTLDKELVEPLKRLAREQHATLFMTLLAAFKVLLYRYSGQQDISIGSAAANRIRQEVEGLVGFFVNALTLRSILAEDDNFTSLLGRVRRTTLDAYEHQDIPFEKVVEAVVEHRDMSRSPLFQVMFDMQNNASLNLKGHRLGDAVLFHEQHAITTSKFDLTFVAEEFEDGLKLTVEYCTSLFKAGTISRMVDHYRQLLKSIVADPVCLISKLVMITPVEEAALLQNGKGGEVVGAKQTVLDLIKIQVEKTPDRIALIFGKEQLTFRELDHRSNRLANYLLGNGVAQGSLIPVLMDRGTDMIVSILAIMKAGGVYVPVDPDYPDDRIRFILNDTCAAALITSRPDLSGLSLPPDLFLVDIGRSSDIIFQEDLAPPLCAVTPDSLAYVIYTSGSTGRPKGVAIEHSSLLNYLVNTRTAYLGTEDSVTGTYFHLSYTFDASITSIFMPLLFGKAVVIATRTGAEVFLDESFHKFAPYDFIKLTPAHLALLKECGGAAASKKLIVGGEALHKKHIEYWVENGIEVEIINEYGPTEATVGCSVYSVNAAHAVIKSNNIPIGKPIDNTQLYILDQHFSIVPVGVPGELYIGGSGLARTYLNLDELTAQKFLWVNLGGEVTRLYKTGDTAKWLDDGNIEFLGRKDDQVKVKGYRIELGEIENVLLQSGLVTQAVVMVTEVTEENELAKKLVAYVVPAETFDKEGLLYYAASKLARYMVPDLWIEVGSIPLTSNGKIDKRALREWEHPERSNARYTAPVNEIERTLAQIWQDLLGIEHVGIHDNFFELGGDSITTIQVVSHARRHGLKIEVGDLFEYQTIAGLYEVIARKPERYNGSSAEQGLLTGQSGLLPIQQWYFEKKNDQVSHYNQSVLLNLDKTVSPNDLALVLRELIRQHDALRFKYTRSEQEWQQEYRGPEESSVSIERIDEYAPDVIEQLCDDYQRRLDITQGEVIKMVMIQTPGSEEGNRLFIVIHHLCVDGVSWRILLEDLEYMLSSVKNGEPFALAEKTGSYRQWYNALTSYSVSQRCVSQKEYWKQVLRSRTQLPVDFVNDKSVRQEDLSGFEVKLSLHQTRNLLQKVPLAYRTEINDVLLCALAKTISRWSGSAEVLIGLDGHGRESLVGGVDISRTIGWFTNLYPVRLSVDPESAFPDLIRSVKEQLRQIPDKGMGYGVLKYISKEKDLQVRDPWAIAFNYLGQFDNVAAGGRWFSRAAEAVGREACGALEAGEPLAVNSMVQGGCLILNWSFSTLDFEADTIRQLAQAFVMNLNELIDHCVARAENGSSLTPSDYGLTSEITVAELDMFLNEGERGMENIMDF